MSGNRFDFLEFSGATPVDVEHGGKPTVDITADPGAEVARKVDQDGRPLAQVVDVDVRGYRAFLAQDPSGGTSIFSAMATASEAAYDLRLVEVFGGRGIKAGQFNFPAGIAVDSKGDLLVADSYNHRVQRIKPDGGVWLIGGRGTGLTQLLSPQAVAVDSEDSYYIVEQGNNRVQKFTADGALDLVIGQPGELAGPTGIAVSTTGDIYVADNGNCRIKRFDRDGNFLMSIGSGVGPGVLTTPQSVALDKSDNVFVLDTFGHRVVQFDPIGRYAKQFGSRITAPMPGKAYFVEPRAVASDFGDLLYVADTGGTMADGTHSRGRLQVIDVNTGEALLSIDRLGRNYGCLFRPSGIAIAPSMDERGDLYISDTMNHRILRFAWSKR
jgi:DNA-binding beta-propeller fold protein YncE